ncbi:hypothetical protein C1646_750655 [Rhizophagus diaphanus]|nr:hypothetical protein C1646_750655 [Rhizophagus diaphanus] [Rhizophagus sp. MUCL 43196]
MWELMTGRRPFWDRSHDAYLIIEICDGRRPPIITNAPKGYTELMKKCWHSDPTKRPTAKKLYRKIRAILRKEWKCRHNPTKIIESPNIGPIIKINPKAIYKSRPLSTMIRSAENTINIKKNDKRKFDEFIENNEEDKNDKIINTLLCVENNGYLTKEYEFDIYNDLYTTREIKFDI